jgi:sugar phosphate isomerase/epimerase
MDQPPRAVGAQGLVACHLTLCGTYPGRPARHDFASRVAAAADAGFGGIGLTEEDYRYQRERGMRREELRRIVDDHGIRVVEIEFGKGWAGGAAGATPGATMPDTLFEMADVFEPHHVNVGELLPADELPPRELVAERFAALCDRARRHGLLVGLEFFPYSGIPDVAAAAEIVGLADCANGGVVLDVYHYFLGNPDEAALSALPASRVVCIQLRDAPAGAHHDRSPRLRLLPGAGCFDLVGMVRLLDAMGVDAPFEVESTSPELRTLTVEDVACRAYDATSAVLQIARRDPPGLGARSGR